MASPLNSSWFDVGLQLSGITLCGLLLWILEYSRSAYRLTTLKFYLVYSLITTITLALMLQLASPQHYAAAYWITQAFSYLLEVSICIQLAKEAIDDNWHVTTLFGPIMVLAAVLNMILFGIPRNLRDVTSQVYIASIVCGYMLLLIWLVDGRLKGKLKQPYIGIYFVFTAYITSRLCINYLVSYSNGNHWGFFGRLQPTNEILLLVGWIVAVFLAASPKQVPGPFSDSIEL